MSDAFHVQHCRILGTTLALGMVFSGCQDSPSPLERSVAPLVEPVEQRPRPVPNSGESDIPDIPRKPIAEIAAELERHAGFVLAGAYVLELEPTGKVDGDLTHRTIGYLPVGRLVYLDACDTEIGLRPPSKDFLESLGAREKLGTYCRTTTHSGLEGFVRIDRVVRLGDSAVAIATGDEEILVSTGDSHQTFSRSVGTYVEILDGPLPECIRVRMPWSNPEGMEGCLPESSEARYSIINKTLHVPVPVSFQPVSDNAAKRIEQIFGLPLNQILEDLSDRFPNAVDTETMSKILCGLEIDVFAELGFTVAGSGGGARGQLRLLDSGFAYDYDLEVLQAEGKGLPRVGNGETP